MHHPGPAVEPHSWPSTAEKRSDDHVEQTELPADLLEQELCSVRDGQLRHSFRALAVRAPSIITHQAAFLTCIHLKLVGRYHETFEEELCRPVAN